MKAKRRVKKFFDNFFNVLKRPEMLVLPGQLAFFFILSVVPILTLLSYVASSMKLSTAVLTDFINHSFGNAIVNLLMPNVSEMSFSFGFILIIIIGLYFASNGASSIIVTSNTIYGIEDQGFLRRKIKAIIMTLFMIILFLFILVVPLFGDSIVSLINNLNINDQFNNTLVAAIRILNGPLSWFIIFFFIKILYTMAPDKNIPSSQTTYGAIFTSIGWIIVTAIYSFYINNYAQYQIFYGGFANIIILMLWTYLLAFIFVVGLALNYRRDELGETWEIHLPKKNKNKNTK